MMAGVRSPSKRNTESKNARASQRQLVVTDQEPIRRAATAECRVARERLDRARAGWHRFEREDKPAFARWRAREFGAILSEAREVESQIRDCQALMHEVEMEMRRGFQDAHSAYQRVLFRREDPHAVFEDDASIPTSRSRATPRLSEFEQEALFQDWVKKFLGTHPDKMDDDVYSMTFTAFKSHMFASPPEDAPRRNPQRRPERKSDVPEPSDEEAAAPVDSRVKELYRILVRRLHPDLKADGVVAVSMLWHEVQEAYAASDVARLELLLALSKIEANHLGDDTSLSQMRAVLADLNRALRALEKSLLEAHAEDAWNFARTGASGALRVRVGRELKADLAARKMRLAAMTQTIAGWAQGPIANPRSAGCK